MAEQIDLLTNVTTDEMVAKCARLHQKLSDVIDKINKCYGFQVWHFILNFSNL